MHPKYLFEFSVGGVLCIAIQNLRQSRPEHEQSEDSYQPDAAQNQIPRYSLRRCRKRPFFHPASKVRGRHFEFAFLQLEYAKPFSTCFASLSLSPYGYCPPIPARASTMFLDFTP